MRPAAGLADFVIKGTWIGWFAPAGTPPAIVNKLADEVKKALKDPHVEKTLVDGGFEPDGRSPAEFANFVRSEYWRYLPALMAHQTTMADAQNLEQMQWRSSTRQR